MVSVDQAQQNFMRVKLEGFIMDPPVSVYQTAYAIACLDLYEELGFDLSAPEFAELTNALRPDQLPMVKTQLRLVKG